MNKLIEEYQDILLSVLAAILFFGLLVLLLECSYEINANCFEGLL